MSDVPRFNWNPGEWYDEVQRLESENDKLRKLVRFLWEGLSDEGERLLPGDLDSSELLREAAHSPPTNSPETAA